jgi:hypothetical protein
MEYKISPVSVGNKPQFFKTYVQYRFMFFLAYKLTYLLSCIEIFSLYLKFFKHNPYTGCNRFLNMQPLELETLSVPTNALSYILCILLLICYYMFRRSRDLRGNCCFIAVCFYKIGVSSLKMAITPKHVEGN